MKQDHPELGKAPGETDKRDAIHIAIVPVTAAHRLTPGQHVGRVSDTTFGQTDNPIGIVDPFLLEPVEKDQSFWLCLYPYSITSLRHVWTHPAFVPKLPIK